MGITLGSSVVVASVVVGNRVGRSVGSVMPRPPLLVTLTAAELVGTMVGSSVVVASLVVEVVGKRVGRSVGRVMPRPSLEVLVALADPVSEGRGVAVAEFVASVVVVVSDGSREGSRDVGRVRARPLEVVVASV